MKNFLLQMLLPTFMIYGKVKAIEFGQKLHDSNPEACKRVLETVYPLIDVELEKFAAESENKVDDQVVADLKEVFETVAAANGIELPNLDKD